MAADLARSPLRPPILDSREGHHPQSAERINPRYSLLGPLRRGASFGIAPPSPTTGLAGGSTVHTLVGPDGAKVGSGVNSGAGQGGDDS